MKNLASIAWIVLLPMVAIAQWQAPINLGAMMNSSVADNTPSISAGGDSLVWASFRPGGMGGMDIWMSVRQVGGDWGTPINMPAPVNSTGTEATPCFSSDGTKIYFSAIGRGGEGGWDLFVCEFDGENWSESVNLGAGVNSAAQDWHPYITPDGNRLYFSSSRGDSDDIFFSDWDGEAWGEAQLLPGAVNTDEYDEESPSLVSDGSFLCYSTARPGGLGGPDIWGSYYDFDTQTWGEPFHLGDDLNSGENDQFPAIAANGSFMVIISDRDGGQGNYDLWESTYSGTYTVFGIVGLSDAPIDSAGTLVVIGEASTTTNVHGYYEIGNIAQGETLVQFAHDGYEPYSETVNVSGDVELDVTLEPGSPPTGFDDDFENGLSAWIGTWELTDAEAHGGTYSLTDSPGGNYLPNREKTVTMIRGIDLTEALGAELSFWTLYDIEQSFDFCYVEATVDGGESWDELLALTGTISEWEEISLDLGGYASEANLAIRFRFTSDGALELDGVYIDDLHLAGLDVDTTPPHVRHTPIPKSVAIEAECELEFDIRDISGVEGATLFYSIDGSEEVQADPPTVDGNIYTFTIPQQYAGCHVWYRLETSDNAEPVNSGSNGPWDYYCGRMIVYDDSYPEFIYDFGYNQSMGVRFTPDETTKLAGLLFNFYRDPSHSVDSVDVHVWDYSGTVPGTDLIQSKAIYPINTLQTPHAWTFADLRERNLEVSEDFVAGCVFRSVYPVILGDSPVAAERSYVRVSQWVLANQDYYVRAIVGDFPESAVSEPIVTLPSTFEMADPWPNPFNSWCTVLYQVPYDKHAELVIYDMLGRQVLRVPESEVGSGIRRYAWDGCSADGKSVASGVYIIRLEAAEAHVAKKVVFIR